ERGSGR
nr:Chain C, Heterocyst inhibition-signaling peptide [Nostoc sp. PCC 7120 = FACHB-418]4YNL_D Chain D, Heterocyst inhibition-signaling peptide [Nostoc sp. PCC 7120 = FACHB-418]4YNL_P Chain P, Heterocyst inhibition-signaling peptide [Nostoc sp. PCC 7120 = FACHB-418]4YNL_R Chain R, Heterocyst inhibition-signaling peptide [Nostoc sp. PCC 7120 = FACHB-418]